jgi:predicted  nucleic acid-binding Zn-ribbon protein
MDEDRLARLEQRLDELDQRSTSLERTMDRAMDRSRAAVNTMVPQQTRKHMRAAWRENLLAARSLIDYWAERLAEKPESEEQSRDGARQSIPID